MKKVLLFTALPLLLCSCISTTSPTGYIRVVELGVTNTIALPGLDAVIGGCRAEVMGDISSLVIDYRGEKCTVRSAEEPSSVEPSSVEFTEEGSPLGN